MATLADLLGMMCGHTIFKIEPNRNNHNDQHNKAIIHKNNFFSNSFH